MNLIRTDRLNGRWINVQKTATMLAKHITALLSSDIDPELLKVRTLEGDAQLKANCMLCKGIQGELWPQSSTKILERYDLISVREDGWLVFAPKKSNTLGCLVTSDLLPDGETKFCIHTLWGSPAATMNPDDPPKFLQEGKVGDYILTDGTPGNYWVIDYKVFCETYSVL